MNITRSQLADIISTCVNSGFDQSAEGFNSEHGNDLQIRDCLHALTTRLTERYTTRFLDQNSASPSAPASECSADSPAGACQPGGATLKRYRPVIYGGPGKITEYGMFEHSKGEWIRFTDLKRYLIRYSPAILGGHGEGTYVEMVPELTGEWIRFTDLER